MNGDSESNKRVSPQIKENGAKKILLHDIGKFFSEGIFSNLPEDIYVIPANPPVEHCRGCFSCWIKTPGRCIIEDNAQSLPEMIAECDEFIIVSRMVYGGFSPDIKAYVDRLIPSLLPFFKVKNGRMMHPNRHKNKYKITFLFYSDEHDEAFSLEGNFERKLQEFAQEVKKKREGLDATLKNTKRTVRRCKPIQAPDAIDEESTAMKFSESVANNLGAKEYESRFVGDIFNLSEVLF